MIPPGRKRMHPIPDGFSGTLSGRAYQPGEQGQEEKRFRCSHALVVRTARIHKPGSLSHNLHHGKCNRYSLGLKGSIP